MCEKMWLNESNYWSYQWWWWSLHVDSFCCRLALILSCSRFSFFFSLSPSFAVMDNLFEWWRNCIDYRFRLHIAECAQSSKVNQARKIDEKRWAGRANEIESCKDGKSVNALCLLSFNAMINRVRMCMNVAYTSKWIQVKVVWCLYDSHDNGLHRYVVKRNRIQCYFILWWFAKQTSERKTKQKKKISKRQHTNAAV